MDCMIYKLRNRPDLAEKAAGWFHAAWQIPLEVYVQSIRQCIEGKDAVPQWYVMLDREGNIVSGAGVIENDFHKEERFRPNVCAVFTAPRHRGKGLAGEVLAEICRDMAALGEEDLYLLTDHTNFYEKYGWTYIGEAGENSGGTARVYHKRTDRDQ